jgi:hypothetical protein
MRGVSSNNSRPKTERHAGSTHARGRAAGVGDDLKRSHGKAPENSGAAADARKSSGITIKRGNKKIFLGLLLLVCVQGGSQVERVEWLASLNFDSNCCLSGIGSANALHRQACSREAFDGVRL